MAEDLFSLDRKRAPLPGIGQKRAVPVRDANVEGNEPSTTWPPLLVYTDYVCLRCVPELTHGLQKRRCSTHLSVKMRART